MRNGYRRATWLVLLGCLIWLAAGCAPGTTPASPSEEPTMSGPSEPSPSASTSGPPTTAQPSPGDELTIRYDNGNGTVSTWTLTCAPAGGNHPDPKAACAALQSHEVALQPVPPDRACTEQYGGPQTATITGTWRGQPVNSMLSRTNGCEIARWDALAGLLPRAGS